MSNVTISGGSCGSGGAVFTGVVDSGVSNASSESELLGTHNKRGGEKEGITWLFFPPKSKANKNKQLLQSSQSSPI